ncbi:DUF2789 domain-containing protein [Hydrogenophaga sp. YM1]|uniref:DUF2789 domain-containing protein n=1 Tax=Hydrogenophaga sp. YM1 TaxID=2806262 RepID=UPI001EF7276A|nr:DUF2789 domain-containing protein [Hydrogenophaga sp. YM1]
MGNTPTHDQAIPAAGPRRQRVGRRALHLVAPAGRGRCPCRRPYWNEAQGQFPCEQIKADSDWPPRFFKRLRIVRMVDRGTAIPLR